MIYKIIVDKQPMTNPSEEKKEYEIDIAPLYFKHDVYDSLVITKGEDYVMRRLELQDYNVLVELNPPVKEPLTDINIELFEGENYIYLYDMAGNKIVAQYLIKNEFNELYVLESEMHSAIRQSASEIELSVGGQITTLDGAVQDINGELSLKVDKNDNDQVVSMINASADEINLRSNRLVIDSTNFKLNSAGNITATGGNIADFNITNEALQRNISGLYEYDNYDLANIINIIMTRLDQNVLFDTIYDINDDNDIDIGDFRKVYNIIAGTQENTRIVNGSVEIHSNNPKKCIEIKNGSTKAVSLGINGIDSFNISTKNFTCGTEIGSTFGTLEYRGITMNGGSSNPMFYFQGNNNAYTTIDDRGINTNGEIHTVGEGSFGTIQTLGNVDVNGTVTCTQVIQTSKEEAKKNFEKLPSGLDIIKDIDIYKYNLKAEEDNTKKHIGFVIGDKYKYSKEVTSKENDGVDIYSFVAVCCKAIQEQQEEIEELKARIEKLEKGDK